jgi:solute:Na+ symporter, SSS family
MQSVDYYVIVLYLIGIVAAGMVFAGRMKSSSEMFSAGGKSPWWVSGLSGFMTMFSAGTFVVWGGIAYRYGFVAVAINMCYGVAALLVGWFVAGRWRALGVSSAADFLQLRFGGPVVQFYTWFQGAVNIGALGGSIYALSKIVTALIPIPAGHLLADAATGHLSVTLTSIAICLLVITITFAGGLWAVLMTDVLQFVILTVSVVFVIPLILGHIGGWDVFIERAPAGFTAFTADDFTWWFLAGWVVIHFFKIGGEWAFVQRFTCVPTSRDAKKSAYLFGAMYLLSPLFWMLPPLVYRVINPDADYEQAYILACQTVLPAGMLGLMIAAMASATASMATTQLNVFAGAFTTQVYQRFINRKAVDAQVVFAGRVFTIILGGVVITSALLIPRYGYTRFILDITALIIGPMVLPTIWGLFSRKIGLSAVWVTTGVGFLSAFVVKFGFAAGGFLTDVGFLNFLADWIADNRRVADLCAGIIVPFGVLVFMEILSQKVHPGWVRVEASASEFHEQPDLQSSTLPAVMVTITLVIIAVVMAGLAVFNSHDAGILGSFAVVLLAIASGLFWAIKRTERIN